MRRLVGITGLAGSGKDTAAQVLVENEGYVREAFADRMRAAMLALNPWVDRPGVDPIRLVRLVNRVGWDAAKRDYPEVRRLLQRFGTEAGREIHGTNCWVDLLMLDWIGKGKPHTVVTDCRFNNEAQAIRDAGGIVIEVLRPGLERLPGGHASEAGLPPELIDYRVENRGTIGDLHHLIAAVVTS